MKRSSAELKSFARSRLQGHYTIAVEIILSYFALIFFLNWIGLLFFPLNLNFSFIDMIGNMALSILSSMLSIGVSYCFLALNRGWQVRISDLFLAFRYHSDKALCISLFYMIASSLIQFPVNILYSLSLLSGDYFSNHVFFTVIILFTVIVCFVLSIILWLNISMCYYIYMDHPDLHTSQIIKMSFQMMRGNKMRYFYVNISFFGMILLSMITCFIGMIWVLPYISSTTAAFYQELNYELSPKTEAGTF